MNSYSEKETETVKQAIEEFGSDTQIIVAIEECSELVKSLTKHIRNKKDKLYQEDDIGENIAEETADVLIMIRQLMYIFENEEKVKKYKREKLKRLQERLDSATQKEKEREKWYIL